MKKLRFILILTTIFSINIVGQNKTFDVKIMKDPSINVVQANTEFPKNALILIYSNIEDVKFTSSRDGINQQKFNRKANRYEILINPVPQIISISHPEFNSTQLYKFEPQPKEVFYFRIGEKIENVSNQPGFLNLKTIPAKCNVVINGIPLAVKPPLSLDLPVGINHLQLSRNRFLDFDTVFSVSPMDSLKLEITLEYKFRKELTSNQIRLFELQDEISIAAKRQNYQEAQNLKQERIIRESIEKSVKNEDFLRAAFYQKELISYTKIRDSLNSLKSIDKSIELPRKDSLAIRIGEQMWMQNNLKVDTFKNGDPIIFAQTEKEWKKANKKGLPAYCHYNFDKKNEEKYGKLYNWYAVNDPRGIGPEGWKVPTDDDWKTLEKSLGADTNDIMKTGWRAHGVGKRLKGYGENSIGFNAALSGYASTDGQFLYLENFGFWWTATEQDKNNAFVRSLSLTGESILRNPMNKSHGVSVRLIKN